MTQRLMDSVTGSSRCIIMLLSIENCTCDAESAYICGNVGIASTNTRVEDERHDDDDDWMMSGYGA